MKIENPFFRKVNEIKLLNICKTLNIKISYKNLRITGINDLRNANKNEISFFNSLKYFDLLKNTKAKFVVTNIKYKKIVDKYSNALVVDNVLKSVGILTSLFYPDSLNDLIDFNIDENNIKKYKNIKHGKNVLVGENVKIGKNTSIGHNTIIESNVVIGRNCSIGNNIIIKNSLIGKNVTILDGSIIGKKGFGFFPDSKINYKYPHVGMVIIKDNAEIGSSNTIDRGSLSNTVIGTNTFLDNQVHIAHNVNIGNNCIITAQVGFAGSSSIGNKVLIGGQAGISGHLKIGNNVQIGGGSGVIKDIPDNSRVMGYPAQNIRNFLKKKK